MSDLFLQGDEENLQRAEHLVKDFCQAAGAKINWHKTQGLWFSEQEKPRCDDFQVSWIYDGEVNPQGSAIGPRTSQNK